MISFQKYNIEADQLLNEIQLLYEISETKEKLQKVFEKYDIQESSQINDHSTIEKIKNVASVGLEASKIANIIENFITTHRIVVPKESIELLNKYRGNYSLIEEYMGDNIHSIYIMDFMISLVTSYQTGLILYNILRKFCDTKTVIEKREKSPINVIGNHDYAKKIIHCLALFSKYRGDSFGIQDILVNECYSLDLDVLEKELKIELVVKSFNEFENADISKILKLFDGFDFKNNFFQSVNNFCDNATRLHYNCDNLNSDEIFNTDYYHIMGDLIYTQNKSPLEYETIINAMGFNIYHIIIENCVESININRFIENSSLEVLNENLLKSNLEIMSLEKRHYFKMNTQILDYISKHDKIVSYLISEIFDLKMMKIMPNILNNYINLESIEQISFIFNGNRMLTALNYDEISCQKMSNVLLDTNISLRDKYELLCNINEHQFKKHFEMCYSTVINKIIESGDISFDFKVLFEKIKNLNERANKLLKYLNHLVSFEGVEQLLNGMIHSDNANELDPKTRDELFKTLNQINVYQEIGNAINITWHQVANMSLENPEILLNNLLNGNHYKLGFKWVEIHPFSNSPLKYSNFIFNLAVALRKLSKQVNVNEINSKTEPKRHDVFRLIETLPKDIVIRFYRKIILQLRNIYLIEYILNFLINNDTDKIEDYRIYQISLNIFKNMTHNDIKDLWLLFSRPLLIIEQFLMNSKFDNLQKIMTSIRPLLFSDRICKTCSSNGINQHHSEFSLSYYSDRSEDFILINIDYNHNQGEITENCIDSLLRIYAAKSLDFRVIENQSSSDTNCGSNEQLSVDSLYGAFVLPKSPPKKEEWVRDEEATNCMCCRRSVFTMLTRRHHCRRCGRVVCHSCSTNRIKIHNMYDEIPVRFCADCVRHTELLKQKNEIDSDDEQSSVESSGDWILCGNIKHDNIVRNEFCYEYAPSVPLCLSILSHHSPSSEYSYFLLYHCKKFENLLRPLQPGYPNPEIDYLLVTRILHCLALAAKVRDGPPECTTIIDHADIILSIVQHGCEALLPMEPMNIHGLRKLRDSLVIGEKWDIALDLSFKCGYSSTGVMAAWGISCLRSGCYETAREKFSHCLPSIVPNQTTKLIMSLLDSSDISKSEEIPKIRRPTKSPPLLSEILSVLKISLVPTSPDVLARATVIKNSNTSLASSKSVKKLNMPTHEPALNILNTLDNLNKIVQGQYELNHNSINSKDKRKDIIQDKSLTTCRYLEECMFYLITYGSHTDLISFLTKNNQLVQALRYIIYQNVDPEIFVSTIYLPYLECGNVENVVSNILSMDSSLKTWQTYIISTCRYLETKSMYNSLYQLQILIKDPVRASMTCVKFYSMYCATFSELKSNSYHLRNAQDHLQSELELCQWNAINAKQRNELSSTSYIKESTITMKIDSKSLNNHINTILRQIEVTKFLAKCEEDQKNPVSILKKLFGPLTTMPTLFGTLQDKIHLCVTILICGKNVEEGFGLMYR